MTENLIEFHTNKFRSNIEDGNLKLLPGNHDRGFERIGPQRPSIPAEAHRCEEELPAAIGHLTGGFNIRSFSDILAHPLFNIDELIACALSTE